MTETPSGTPFPAAAELILSAPHLLADPTTGAVLKDHALVVGGGRVLAVLPAAEARARHPGASHRHFATHVLMPGLVNAHTHSAMSLLRGLADDLPLMEWLNGHVWPAEAKHVGPEFCADGVRLACAEMIASGTTAFNDMYFFPDVTARVANEVGMRAQVGLILMDFPTAWAKDADEYLAKGKSLHEAVAGQALISTVLAPHAPYTVSDGPMARMGRLATDLGVGVHMHVHETAFEVEDAVAKTGERPLARLARMGLLDQPFMAVHMTQLTEAEIALVAEKGVNVVHCPESNLKLASGFCPVGRLLDAGVNVALGTDGAASNNDLDLFGELRTAALLAKAVQGKATALPAPAALAMATVGGARALRLEDTCGRLAPGLAADAIAVDLDQLNTLPAFGDAGLLSHLVYALNSRQVTDVYVAGRCLYQDGRHQTLDAAELKNTARRWQARVGATDR